MIIEVKITIFELVLRSSGGFPSVREAKKDFERRQKKAAKQAKAEERKIRMQQREEALKVYKQKRAEKFKVLSKKTKRGQPLMAGRMDLLLDKIKNQVEAEKAKS